MKQFKFLAAASLGLFALAACETALSTPAATPAPAPAATTAALPANAVTSGTFSGLSDHITTGGASIVGTAGAYELVLASDFSLDGAPDPIVGFGKNGTYNPATKLGALKNKDGSQTYDLPASFNPADVSEVYIWCEKFSVPLGVAKF